MATSQYDVGKMKLHDETVEPLQGINDLRRTNLYSTSPKSNQVLASLNSVVHLYQSACPGIAAAQSQKACTTLLQPKRLQKYVYSIVDEFQTFFQCALQQIKKLLRIAPGVLWLQAVVLLLVAKRYKTEKNPVYVLPMHRVRYRFLQIPTGSSLKAYTQKITPRSKKYGANSIVCYLDQGNLANTRAGRGGNVHPKRIGDAFAVSKKRDGGFRLRGTLGGRQCPTSFLAIS